MRFSYLVLDLILNADIQVGLNNVYRKNGLQCFFFGIIKTIVH